jgi:hypothetical protein
VAKNSQRLGELLLEADVITKRQLAKACQIQVRGDKRKLGDILIELNYVTIEDLTDTMLNTHHDEQINPPIVKTEEIEVLKPKELSENTKFTLSIQTMVTATVGIATLVGFYYMMMGEIQEAKELPDLKSLYEAEYPSRPEGHNWPRSYEQYKVQVGSLQEDMDDVLDQLEEFEDEMDEIQKLI